MPDRTADGTQRKHIELTFITICAEVFFCRGFLGPQFILGKLFSPCLFLVIARTKPGTHSENYVKHLPLPSTFLPLPPLNSGVKEPLYI
jgi:hypothetical protein